MSVAALVAAADPSVTFDLVHVTLSLRELFGLIAQGFDLARAAYCALPFTTC
jgi:hypothetical protein